MARIFKKKNEFSKTIVILDIIIFILYIIINIFMQWNKGYSMPSDINVGVFAYLTGELGLLSFIKRSKIHAEVVQPQIQNAIQLQTSMENNNNNNVGAIG